MQYDSVNRGLEKKIQDVDKEISNTIGLVRKTDCNTKIPNIESNLPSVAGLVTTTQCKSPRD